MEITHHSSRDWRIRQLLGMHVDAGALPATLLSSFTFLTPVFTLIFVTWWLGKPVTANLVAALVLVGLGIVLVNRK